MPNGLEFLKLEIAELKNRIAALEAVSTPVSEQTRLHLLARSKLSVEDRKIKRT